MTARHHTRKRPSRGEPVVAEALSALLKDIRPGCEILAVTGGKWSLAELVVGLLGITGPAHVDIATWTAAQAAIGGMDELLESSRVLSIRWLLDRSFPNRQPKYAERLLDTFGPESVRCARTHAKWVTIKNDDWSLAVRTSMNLNSNPRTEFAEISDDPGVCGFLRSIVDSHWVECEPGFPGHAAMTRGQRAAMQTVKDAAGQDDLADLFNDIEMRLNADLEGP